MKPFAVVILNWNAARDTVECLASLLSNTRDALPIVIDNASEDDSVSEIQLWARARSVEVVVCGVDVMDRLAAGSSLPGILLVRSNENLGFAKGCNLGLRAVRILHIDEVVFLNNDAVVSAGALSRLVERLRCDPSVFATIPLVLTYGTRSIWNLGGEISRLGYRRYHFAGAVLDSVALPAELHCSFFTGCCFAVRTEEFVERGGFTERFFFGEEDFELCLWMRDHGKRAVALTDSVIEHKVSLTFSRVGRAKGGKAYLYYLNRLIHMRLRLGNTAWLLWLAGYLPYVAWLLTRTSTVSVRELPGFIWKLVADARRHDGVDRALFMRIMRATT